jgi:hypothetical protein
MYEDDTIPLEIYSYEHQDRERFNDIEKWMKIAKAIKIIGGEKHVIFPKYDEFILKYLDEARNDIEVSIDIDSHDHWFAAFDFFHTRHEYIHQLRHKFLCDEDIDQWELKRQFKVVSLKFREIAERFVLACQLQLNLKLPKRDLPAKRLATKKASD